MLAEARAGTPPAPGRPARHAYAYQRHGSANVFGDFEPLRGWREVEVSTRRTKPDVAPCLQRLVDEFSPSADTILVVLDNRSTHTKAALSATFPPAEARRLARTIEFHPTPKQGSWLTAVEIEFAVLSTPGLDRRIGDIVTLARAVAAWVAARNAAAATVDWQVRTADARIRLRRLHPTTANPSGR